MAYPDTYRYTKEHEWIDLNGSIGTVGLTDYAQSTLGDIVFVDLPKVGDPVTANETFGSVESVKAVSDLSAHPLVDAYFKNLGEQLAPRLTTRGPRPF